MKVQQALVYGNYSHTQDRSGSRLHYPSHADSLPNVEGWHRYLVKSGDSLGRISQLFDVSVEEIKNVNQLSSNHIRVGDTLLLPRKAPNLSYRIEAVTSQEWR